MSLSNLETKTLYDCGGDLVYTIPFDYFDDSEIRVVHRSVLGVETVLKKDEDFDVPAYGEENYGSIVLIGDYAETPPDTGEKLLVKRVLPLTQLIELTSDLDVVSLMEALDRALMLIQQLQEQIDRATLTDETEE